MTRGKKGTGDKGNVYRKVMEEFKRITNPRLLALPKGVRHIPLPRLRLLLRRRREEGK